MIIKSTRILATASPRRFCDHVFRGEENDRVAPVQGTETDIIDAFRDARARGDTYALRHWIIAPARAITAEEFTGLLVRLADEFAFSPNAAVIQHHTKPRVDDDAFDEHWHVQVPERDQATGKGLSTSHDHARHEYLARRFEIEHGHPIIPGAHTRAVLARLRAEGLTALADALDQATDGSETPQSGFKTEVQREAARGGIDLPEARRVIQNAWRATNTADELVAALEASGIKLRRGDKEDEIIALVGDNFIGSLRRLARVSKAEITARIGDWNDGTTSIGGRPDHAEARLDRQPDDRDRKRSEVPRIAASEDGEAALDDDRGRHPAARAGEPPSAGSDRGPSQAHTGTGNDAGNRAGLEGLSGEFAELSEIIAGSLVIAMTEATPPLRRIEEAFNAAREEIECSHAKAASRNGSGARFNDADLSAMIIEGEKRLAETQRAYSEIRNALGGAEAALAGIEARQQSFFGRVRGIIDSRDEAAAQQARDEIVRLRDAATGVVQELTRCTSHLLNCKADIARNAKAASASAQAAAASEAQLDQALKAFAAHRQAFHRVARYWPPIIFCGVGPARRIAAEIERQGQYFGDPDAKNIWGLPVRGPGTGDRRA